MLVGGTTQYLIPHINSGVSALKYTMSLANFWKFACILVVQTKGELIFYAWSTIQKHCPTVFSFKFTTKTTLPLIIFGIVGVMLENVLSLKQNWFTLIMEYMTFTILWTKIMYRLLLRQIFFYNAQFSIQFLLWVFHSSKLLKSLLFYQIIVSC